MRRSIDAWRRLADTRMLAGGMSHSSLRVLVFGLPPLLRDLVREALESHVDIETISADAGDLGTVVADQRPDAIIVPTGVDGLLAEVRLLLEERARLRVLGLGLRDGGSVLIELRVDRSNLGEVSPHELADLLRAALDVDTSF